MLLRFLDPMLRGAAGVGSWQVVSQGRAVAEGQLVAMPNLEGVQVRMGGGREGTREGKWEWSGGRTPMRPWG